MLKDPIYTKNAVGKKFVKTKNLLKAFEKTNRTENESLAEKHVKSENFHVNSWTM